MSKIQSKGTSWQADPFPSDARDLLQPVMSVTAMQSRFSPWAAQFLIK